MTTGFKPFDMHIKAIEKRMDVIAKMVSESTTEKKYVLAGTYAETITTIGLNRMKLMGNVFGWENKDWH